MSTRLRLAFFTLFLFLLTCGALWLTRTRPGSTHTTAGSSPAAIEKPEDPATSAPQDPAPSPGDATTGSTPPDQRAESPSPPNPPPVATGENRPPRISTRAEAARGRTVAGILKDADMSDPEVRARKVAEMRQLEEDQNRTVVARAAELGIPIRKDGPGHRVATLYDIIDGIPLYRTTLNANAAISTGANLLSPAPYSLNGTGVKVGVWDGGSVRNTHQELTGRVTKRNGSSANDDHATHVAGTIAASGVQPAAKGMAPSATIDSYDWDSDYSEMTSAGAATSGDTSRIPLSNHSYGYEIEDPDDYMGVYETEASAVDGIAAGLPYYLPFWAAGNEQDLYTSLGGYQSITFNGLAKNVVTIGAANDAVSGGVRNPANATIASFSSLGPCDDGRIKPDLVANGINLYSSVATGNTAYDGTYSGTSMATPNAMGSAILLQQLYGREFSGQRMRASSLKALLIHTADDRGNAGPDYTYGWGLINVKAAADVILSHKASLAAPKIIEDSLTAGTTKTHTFIWDGVSPIRATLCWTDPAGTAQTAANSRTPNLRHNLDAKITAPNGATQYSPYVMPFVGTWTQASMNSPATTGKNNVDNVEQVYLAAPSQAGTYTIAVSVDGAITGSQVYSLIITGGTDVESNPPPQVALASPAGGATYLPGAPVTVSATASDMAIGGNPGAVSQVEFFAGTTSLGVDTTAPYSVTWSSPAAGTHAITAKATDNEAAVATSAAATIHVLTGDGSPVISSFTPSSGAGGSAVVLSGTNFADVVSVKFNGTEAAFTVDSLGQITATVPALATTGTLTVTNGYGTGTSSTPFTIVQAPVLISQVYGGGGNGGATWRNDYVELYNRSDSAVSVTGWSVQYASASGTSWQVTSLTGSIPAGKHFLVSLASGGAVGTVLPTPDSSVGFNLSASNGKVPLLNSATAFTGSSPNGAAGLQDFVGYGTANAFEGSAAAPSHSNTTAIFRAGNGATDSGQNSADFAAAAPNPRNTGSTPPGAPVITSATTATATVGASFTYQITASNSPASYNATGLPAGLVVNTSTGAITGTPSAAGSSTVTLSATNATGTGTAGLALTINSAGGGGDPTHILSEDFVSLTTGSNTTTTGPSSTVWSGNSNFPTVASGYSAGGMIKLGTGSLAGSITSKTIDLSPNGGNFFVSFKVKGWTTVEGNIKVTVTGLAPQTVTYTSLIGGSLETKVLSFTGGMAGSTIRFETTARRAFLDDILVYYTTPPAGDTFADWLAGYTLGGLTGVGDDPDHDGIANGIENILGTAPDTSTPGLTAVSATANTFVFRHTISKEPASDLTFGYEWSTDLASWHASTASAGGVAVTIAGVVITNTPAPANDVVEVTATVTTGSTQKLYLRMKAVKPQP